VNACTWYPVIGVPPADAGAVQLTAAERLPAVAVPRVGAPGASTVMVRSLNCSFSMFLRVSVPSPTNPGPWSSSPATSWLRACVTVSVPLAPVVEPSG
jgi:hypothetical protein